MLSEAKPRFLSWKNSYIILSSLCLLILINTSQSQVQQEWIARYNGPTNEGDGATSMAIDGLGNVYVTGGSYGNGTYMDYATIKYNATGNQLWVARYNGQFGGNDEATSIAVDNSGNVYVTGHSDVDYVTIKYDANGNQIWLARYDGPVNGEDVAFSIAIDNSGNIYVTGFSYGSGTSIDYATVKYNSNGIQIWTARYNGPGNSQDIAQSIAIDYSGNVYITGFSYGNNTFADYATIKYSANGSQLWVSRYNGPGNWNDMAYSIAVDNTGNVYVTGYSRDFSDDYTTIKYDANGNQIWLSRYNGSFNSYDEAYSLAIDNSNNVYVTGFISNSFSGYDYGTVKYNANGNQLWVAQYNGPGNYIDIAKSIAIDNFGNVYVTGWSIANANYDYATVKYSASGEQQWVQRYSGAGNSSDYVSSIAVDGSSNVYVTGASPDIGTGSDYVTIKYSQTVGIQPVSNEIPKGYKLFQNYPNPFNPSTKIKFDIPQSVILSGAKNLHVKLTIYNILGREVESLVNEELEPGSYEVEFDVSNFPSGIYFYTLIAPNFMQTNKMMLLK